MSCIVTIHAPFIHSPYLQCFIFLNEGPILICDAPFILSHAHALASRRCAAACCAHAASNPYSGDACTAWTLNGWSQCSICTSQGNQTVVVVNQTKCEHKGGSPCSTGVVTPPAPPPPPPSPQTGKLGGEGSVEYVNYATNYRWPAYLNGTQFATSDVTPEGYGAPDGSFKRMN